MFLRRMVILAAATATLTIATAAPALADDPPAPPGTPTATTFTGTPTVGPIFRSGLDDDHGCTASVIASPTRDLVLTAAHCVYGTAVGWQFAPGYDGGATPYGVWTVTAAYVAPQWLADQDPRYDYAILRVADQGTGRHATGVQDVTGADLLGVAPRNGATITDVAYNEGSDDDPITCTTTAYYTAGFPSFNCHGYVGGSSGSPWLVTVPGTRVQAVVGVIGGLHQGGCYEYTSYSSALRPDAYRLWLRAVAHRPADVAPQPGSDGC